MKRIILASVFVLLFFGLSHDARAGANLAQRIEAAKRQRQAYYQQAAQQRALQQQQQAYQQALQQRAAQQQAYQQAMQQRAVQQQAYQQALQQRAAQQQAYQQAMRQRAVQQQQAYQQAVQQKAAALTKSVQQAAFQSAAHEVNYITQPTVEDVVDISQIWRDFEISSEAWPLIIDVGPKELTVSRYINWYRQQGIYIRKAPIEYVQIIDELSAAQPEILKKPFHELLQIVAIIEYDFDNGMNKEQMAKQILGDKGYQANKKRLGR